MMKEYIKVNRNDLSWSPTIEKGTTNFYVLLCVF